MLLQQYEETVLSCEGGNMEKIHISSFFFSDFRVSYKVMDSLNPITKHSRVKTSEQQKGDVNL